MIDMEGSVRKLENILNQKTLELKLIHIL